MDEKAFYPGFLEGCSGGELAVLQHDLRTFPEDKPYLEQVLHEIKRRAGDAAARPSRQEK